MVDYETFMSVGLNKCGSDDETFAALAHLWTHRTESIREMDEHELRHSLECP
jgi:hypothetical protein